MGAPECELARDALCWPLLSPTCCLPSRRKWGATAPAPQRLLPHRPALFTGQWHRQPHRAVSGLSTMWSRCRGNQAGARGPLSVTRFMLWYFYCSQEALLAHWPRRRAGCHLRKRRGHCEVQSPGLRRLRWGAGRALPAPQRRLTVASSQATPRSPWSLPVWWSPRSSPQPVLHM